MQNSGNNYFNLPFNSLSAAVLLVFIYRVTPLTILYPLLFVVNTYLIIRLKTSYLI